MNKKEERPIPQPFLVPKTQEDLNKELSEKRIKALDNPLRTQLYIRETAKKRLEEKLALQMGKNFRKKQPFDPNIEVSKDIMKQLNVEKLAKIPYAVPQATVNKEYHTENLFEKLKATK